MSTNKLSAFGDLRAMVNGQQWVVITIVERDAACWQICGKFNQVLRRLQFGGCWMVVAKLRDHYFKVISCSRVSIVIATFPHFVRWFNPFRIVRCYALFVLACVWGWLMVARTKSICSNFALFAGTGGDNMLINDGGGKVGLDKHYNSG